MRLNKSNLNIELKAIKSGQYAFYAATFFLASALPISILFFLISFSIYLKDNYKEFFSSKYNRFFGICSILIILSTINSTQNLTNFTNQSQINTWLGICNWIPSFLLFSSFKFYLKTIKQRLNFSKYLISGSIPVIFTCILQYWFNVYGPFETFNGYIIFFMDQLIHNGVSGLFSNQNYNGIWLSITLPFLIYQLINNKYTFLKIFFFLILALTTYFLLLTNSRNGFISAFIIFLIALNKNKLILIISPVLTFIFLFKEKLINFLINISDKYAFLPLKIFERVLSLYLSNAPRFEIFSLSSKLITKHPLLGWGPNTFKNVYSSYGGLNDAQHTHNIFLELAYNFGIPFAVLISIFVSIIILKSVKKTNDSRSNKLSVDFNKAWIICLLVIFINYLNDITYYDGKINLITWIMIAGTASISNINEKNLSKTDF